MSMPAVSVLVPCYNEEGSAARTIAQLDAALAPMGEYEIIAIDDGSFDGTLTVLRGLEAGTPALRIVAHDRNRGYGAALKTGLRHASSERVAIVDADGTYPIEDLPRLVALMDDHDMVVGARGGADFAYPWIRKVPKFFLRAWINWIVGEDVPDINSGMRVFRRTMAQRFVRVLPDGFSFTMTITISALRNNYRVRFEPISYFSRTGKSKISPVRDTLRFMQIICRTGMYFAPLRILAPIAALLGLATIGSLAYDLHIRDLTEKTLLLLTAFLNVSIFALLADMIDKRSSGS